MGEVYEATHERLAGRYAVKVLLAEISNRTDIFQRFRREAEVTSGLRHPNIVQVLDFNVTPQGHPYLVMEFLEGVELAAEIRRIGAFPVSRALNILGQIASALAAAHAHKIVHRDLKPQNLFLVKLPGEDREVVKVVDFGISKVREATTNLTQESAIMGTPQYMAPEQAEGKLSFIDERTDEFSLAVIAYELLTGGAPFYADSIPAIIYQVVHKQPESIRKLSPMVAPAVEAVVMKAMAKEQDERFPTVLAFSRELARAAASDHDIRTANDSKATQPEAPPAPAPATTTTLGGAVASVEVKGSRATATRGLYVGGLALAATVAGLMLWGWNGSQTARPAPVAPERPASMPVPVHSPPPKLATVEAENAPPKLKVTVDGIPTELPVKLSSGPELHTFVFEAPGYEPFEAHVDGTREHRSVFLNMKPLPVAASERPVDRKPLVRSATRRPSPERVVASPPASTEPPAASSQPDKKAKLITDF